MRSISVLVAYDSMNPVLLPEKQGTTILLQLHVSIQQSGERLLYRSPLFALILSAVHGIATMQIQNLNALVDTVRHEIIERYCPGEDDPHLKVLQAARHQL